MKGRSPPGAALSHAKESGLYPKRDGRCGRCLSCPTLQPWDLMSAPRLCFAFSEATKGLLSHAQAQDRNKERMG